MWVVVAIVRCMATFIVRDFNGGWKMMKCTYYNKEPTSLSNESRGYNAHVALWPLYTFISLVINVCKSIILLDVCNLDFLLQLGFWKHLMFYFTMQLHEKASWKFMKQSVWILLCPMIILLVTMIHVCTHCMCST